MPRSLDTHLLHLLLYFGYLGGDFIDFDSGLADEFAEPEVASLVCFSGRCGLLVLIEKMHAVLQRLALFDGGILTEGDNVAEFLIVLVDELGLLRNILQPWLHISLIQQPVQLIQPNSDVVQVILAHQAPLNHPELLELLFNDLLSSLNFSVLLLDNRLQLCLVGLQRFDFRLELFEVPVARVFVPLRLLFDILHFAFVGFLDVWRAAHGQLAVDQHAFRELDNLLAYLRPAPGLRCRVQRWS